MSKDLRLFEGEVAIGDIAVGKRLRQLQPDVVTQLALSMHGLGLICPITLRPKRRGGYWLVAGWHRLKAAQLLGWPRISAVVMKLNAAEAELWAIDENLFVRTPSPAEKLLLEQRKHEILQLTA